MNSSLDQSNIIQGVGGNGVYTEEITNLGKLYNSKQSVKRMTTDSSAAANNMRN